MSATQTVAENTEVTESEVVDTEQTSEAEQPAENAAPAAPKGRKSTAVNLIGTRYEEFVSNGRFQPGHDAKAKSQMITDATSDNPELVAEAERVLGIMNWTHFLTAKRAAIAAKGTKSQPSGERKLTGAAANAQRNKMRREAAESAANGTSGDEALQETLPGGDTIWVRRAKRAIFVMRGEDPISRHDLDQEAAAVAAAQSAHDAAVAEGQTVTLDLNVRSN